MKKFIFLLIPISILVISCKPSVITDVNIDSKKSYSSDQVAIIGILEDIYEVDKEYLEYISMSDIAEILSGAFFDEEKEIGDWLKIKYFIDVKKGEMIKITYTYDKEKTGFDIIYKPYDKDTFNKNIISGYDFISTLGDNVPKSSNKNKSRDASTSSSRLANTKWESRSKYGTYFIKFGQTSFTTDIFVGGTVAGTYKLEGDSVTFIFSEKDIRKGALLGNELTAFTAVFIRVE